MNFIFILKSFKVLVFISYIGDSVVIGYVGGFFFGLEIFIGESKSSFIGGRGWSSGVR